MYDIIRYINIYYVQKQTKRDTHYLIHVHEISLLNHATATKLQYVHVHVRTSSKCVLQYEMCTCCIQSLWKRHRYMQCVGREAGCTHLETEILLSVSSRSFLMILPSLPMMRPQKRSSASIFRGTSLQQTAPSHLTLQQKPAQHPELLLTYVCVHITQILGTQSNSQFPEQPHTALHECV